MAVELHRWDEAPYFFIDEDALDDAVIDEIDETLSYEVDGHEWTDSWKNGSWDGKHRLLKRASNGSYFFPVGLLDKTTEVLDVFGVDYTITGVVRPGRGDIGYEWNTDKTLRDYQNEAVREGLRSGSGVVVLPTGAGKTLIGLRLIYELRQPSIVFVHLQEIADQWVEQIESVLGVDPAVCYGGTRENGDVMVALYQSVYEDGELRDDVRLDHEVALFDEAHTVGAQTFGRVSLSCTARYRYGFTATPEREDGATLRVIGGAGPIIADLSAESLIDKGYLAEPEWVIVESRRSGGHYRKWNDEYKGEIVKNDRRNKQVAEQVDQSPPPCLVTVERIAHGERLASMIDDAEFVHGSSNDRDDIIGRFRSGDLDVMIATRKIVGEGFNVESIRSFVVAGGLRSETSTIQQVGRALRPGETGKARIVDFNDAGRWLSSHSEQRIRTYRDYYGNYGP